MTQTQFLRAIINISASVIALVLGGTVTINQKGHPWRIAAGIGFVVSIAVFVLEWVTGVTHFPAWWYLNPPWEGLHIRASYLAGGFTVDVVVYVAIACFGYLIRKIAVRFVALANGFYVATFKHPKQ
jgi:hypothetical protein